MAISGQSHVVTFYAWDTDANAYKTGDEANFTLRINRDGTEVTPSNSPTEVDATNMPGAYDLTLTAGEHTGDDFTLSGKSDTANVVILPIRWNARQNVTHIEGGDATDALDTSNADVTVGDIAAAALAKFVTDDTGETTAADGSVAKIAQGAASASAIAAALAAQGYSVVSSSETVSTQASRYRGDTWTLSFEDLGNITNYTNVWLTVKSSLEDTDAQAVLQVDTDTGLLRINGASGTASEASITVSDATAGDVSITVEETTTDDIAPGIYHADVQWADASGDITTLATFDLIVAGDVTRAVS